MKDDFPYHPMCCSQNMLPKQTNTENLKAMNEPGYIPHPSIKDNEEMITDFQGRLEKRMETLKKVAARDNTGKPKLSYFRRSFPRSVEAVARVKEFGANKYFEDNWKLGGKPDSEYWDSFDRHAEKYLSGEIYDQDSGCHHLGHMMWNLGALYELNHPDEPAIDEELFQERMEYWSKQKEKENVRPTVVPTPERESTSSS